MCNAHITTLQINRYDPTRTTTLRNSFVREIKKRFNRLASIVRMAVDTEDVFGLKGGGQAVLYQKLNSPGHEAFAFARSEQKLNEFMRWFKDQSQKGILEVHEFQQLGGAIETPWTNKYITDSYKRGIIRSRYELEKAGFGVPSIAETGGVEVSMNAPVHAEKVGLLYSRVFSELQGINAAMDSQISRVLAQGLADGDGPRLLAKKLVSTINGSKMGDLAISDTLGRFIPARRRAEVLARTEIIRAHHQANIQEYRNWGVEGVEVKAEWVTAGDSRVCEKCSGMEGNIYTLDEIQNMIPAHPQCRCIALPKRK